MIFNEGFMQSFRRQLIDMGRRNENPTGFVIRVEDLKNVLVPGFKKLDGVLDVESGLLFIGRLYGIAILVSCGGSSGGAYFLSNEGTLWT